MTAMELTKINADRYINGFVESRIGGRTENQDCCGWADTPSGFLIVVCDGMGGCQGGGEAARIAVDEIIAAVKKGERITTAVKKANSAIFSKASQEPSLHGMGTTCAALLINERGATAIHVGDSRIYQIRNGHKVFRTTDHSLVFESVKNNKMTEEEARISPHSNIITRALGIEQDVAADCIVLPYKKGDRFVLSTDGIHGMLPENELIEMLADRTHTLGSVTDETVDRIDKIGLDAGGRHDNLTLALIETTCDSSVGKSGNRLRWILGIIALLMAIAITFIFSFKASAKIASWRVKPMYEAIKPHSERFYYCMQGGLWGLIDTKGDTILPANYDFITHLHEGMGIFGKMDNGNYRICGLLDENGTSTQVEGYLYLIPEYAYFSQGQLCVMDSSGKKGYLGKDGTLTISCQFDAARPFCEGLASVKKGHWVFYVNEYYDRDTVRNALYPAFHNGYVTKGSSFRGGEAVVGANGKYRVIAKDGSVKRSFDGRFWRTNFYDYAMLRSGEEDYEVSKPFSAAYNKEIEVVKQDGRYGLSDNGRVIIPPLLDSLSEVDANGLAMAIQDGKAGLLGIAEGRPEIEFTKGSDGQVSYNVTLPEEMSGNPSFIMDCGDGTARICGLQGSFKPEAKADSSTAIVSFQLSDAGLVIWEGRSEFPVQKKAELRIAGPYALSKYANIKDDTQKVCAVIRNDSDSDVTVKATLSVKCKLNNSASTSSILSIKANSSERIVVPVKVGSDEKAIATISLDTGEERSSEIYLAIY